MGSELRRFRRVVVASALLQWLVLVVTAEQGRERLVTGLAGGVLLLVAIAVAWFRAAPGRGTAMVLTTGSMGGLGMLLGILLDQYVAGSSVPVCPMHAAAHEGATMSLPGGWLSGFWMNALMFITCVPACVWLCPACATRRASWHLHLACAASMWVGMLVGGKLLFFVPVADWLGALGAMHLAMLAGMLAGVALVLGLRSLSLPAQLRA